MRRHPGWRLLSGLSLAVPLALFGGGVGASHASGPLTAAQVAAYAKNANQSVIIMLKNQHSELSGRASIAARSAAIASDQAPIVRELTQLNAPHVLQYHIINAVSATVSKAEVANLRANPLVQSVMPNAWIPLPKNAVEHPTAATQAAVHTNVVGGGASPLSSVCSTNPNAPLQNESLSQTNDLAATQLKTPQGALIDGTGVTVAFIAEGLDPNNAELIREPSGTPVITDYEDFNGDGLANPDAEGEAFGDASAIAAQGNETYDASQYENDSQATGHPCYIKVRGMAPGASLMVLKAFGSDGTSDATFVEAIDYAVTHGADVLNESFGFFYYPDLNNQAPVDLADTAAVADGVTVTVSTGDAGSQGTMSPPAQQQGVIAVGAISGLRSQEQIGYPGNGRGTGWLSGNMWSGSSGGISPDGTREPDVVSNGFDDWAACTADPLYANACTGFNGELSPIEDFGGTSMSAPETAGEAALVVQAYRSTHNGVSPTPGEVKQIIKSTADNLNFPSYEQGAGLINAKRAVQAALSFQDSNGAPKPQGDQVVYSTHPGTADPASTLYAQGSPSTPESFGLTVTNEGVHTEIVHPLPYMLPNGPTSPANRPTTPVNPTVTNFTVQANNETATPFTDGLGRSAYETTQPIQVKAGMQYLKLAYSWAVFPNCDCASKNGTPNVVGQPGSTVRITLYDPSGRYAGYSNPQGAGSGFGALELHDPQPGTWKAEVWWVGSSYQGPVQLTETQASYISAGFVFPASAPVLPGHSFTFTVHMTTPASPGDQSANILLNSVVPGFTQATVVPVVLRSTIPIANDQGSFSGTLTGANGRPVGTPLQTFAFRVPSGQNDLELNMQLSDSNYSLFGYLVDPAGNPVDVQSTLLDQTGGGTPLAYANTLQYFWRNPQPGLWHFILIINGYISGLQTSEAFTGHVSLNGVNITSDVPNDPSVTLLPGDTATIHVTNTGNEFEYFFVDGRLPNQTDYVFNPAGPLAEQAGFTEWPVPPESTATSAAALSPNNPFDMELQEDNFVSPFGFMDLPAVLGSPGYDPVLEAWANIATIQNGSDTQIPSGFYGATTNEMAPYASPVSGNDSVFIDGSVTTQQFDDSVCPDTGDLWADIMDTNQTNTNPTCANPQGYYNPLPLAPGESGDITVTFTPTDAPGTVESGFLYVDTLQTAGQYINSGQGDELIKIPYTYTVGANGT